MRERIDKIDYQAFLWIVLKESGLSEQQEGELSAWLARDPRHLDAFIRAEVFNMYFNRVAPQLLRGYRIKPPPPVSRRTLLMGGVAAAAAATLAGVAMLGRRPGSENRLLRETGIGEVQKVGLTDAEVLLNTATQMQVDYGPERRATRFLRGEALFTVRADARPFIVQAGGWILRTAAAEFDVRELTPAIRVAVKEGTLQVLRGESQQLRQLLANEEAVLASDLIRVSHVGSAELERRLAWRNGMAIFTGQSVLEALAEMNRYTARPISVSDLRVLKEPLSGQFHISDVSTFVRVLEALFHLRAAETSQGIVLRPGQ